MTRSILLPGLAGDAVMWQAQLAALAAWNPDVSDVHMRRDSVPAMAASLLAESTGLLVLFGASMGGMIAMEAARQAPERIAALALLGTTARPETPEMRQLRETAIELFSQGRVADVIEPNIGFAFHPDHAGDPALVQPYLEFVLRAGAAQLIRQNRAVIGRPDARVHLPRLRCPTLVMCGDSDQLTMVPRCGHMLTMEQPQEVNAALLAWLESHAPHAWAAG